MRAFRPRREHSALYGLSAERIAAIAHVHVTTARRWKRGEEPPYAALTLIELVTTRDLGLLDPAWTGWRLDDKLISPDGIGHTTGDVLSIPFMRQLVATYQSEQRLARQADWIEGRWVPAPEQQIA